ncbi:MAG: response regulator [Bdellovibrionales bacterium]|nr:response regulator [Bdellovibrionales bacterium]
MVHQAQAQEQKTDPRPPLRGKRVLVVEDSVLVAMDIAETLIDAGFSVVGPAANIAACQGLLGEHEVDCAVLDVNLNGEMVYPLAEQLEDRKIPFTFLTGYDEAVLPPKFRSTPRLVKPIKQNALLKQLERLLG